MPVTIADERRVRNYPRPSTIGTMLCGFMVVWAAKLRPLLISRIDFSRGERLRHWFDMRGSGTSTVTLSFFVGCKY